MVRLLLVGARHSPAEYAFGEGQEGNVACVLAESHLSIHTWPHRPAATAAARAV
ncbi:S-adenosylmethionine decarboxylase [Siccirubricoccus deserti]|uniref:S-adenosylmethionine decarboxylase n=1 Tax=Siccirubricoccus deserti TaxID=2013562 RepID=A0A9X0UGB2_9PROT|nr:S-adenosylmethionine decarboxylase [Siccirubricoccus deserti]